MNEYFELGAPVFEKGQSNSEADIFDWVQNKFKD
jgi:hypothetical protein